MSTLRFAGEGGLELVAHAAGDPAALPVLLLHGGGQTRHAWEATAQALARRGAYAVTLDLRGHGESGWSPDGQYRAAAFIADVEQVVRTFAQPPVLVGASLGGAIALFVAAEKRVAVRAIVLVDIALRAEMQGVERIVRFMQSGKAGFASVEEAADAVAAYLPHRPRPERTDGLRKNLRRREDGRWYWHWDPAMLDSLEIGELRASGAFTRAAQALEIPVLLVRGSESDVVSDEIAREFLAAVPQARFADVGGARHMVAGDANDAFGAAILDFLAEFSPA